MIKQNLSDLSEKTITTLNETAQKVHAQSLKSQKSQILKDSPYSKEINKHIIYYEELRLYVSLDLHETVVTRPALIRKIDLDLFVTHEDKTNLELMQSGQAPYLSDDKESIIELHHMRQNYDAPFAELTKREHVKQGNTLFLHPQKTDSWRNEPLLLQKFLSEKTEYWKKRVSINEDLNAISNKNLNKTLNQQSFSSSKELSKEIINSLEMLFKECDINDLHYISNMANSYVLMKEIGAASIEEFILKMKEKNAIQDYIQCPVCGSKEYANHGTYYSGNDKFQRFKCNKCGKTFSIMNQSLISGSNLSFIDWLKFIDCLYNGFSVRKTASVCNLSEKTVSDNRLRLFYALYLLDQRTVLKDKVVIDETYFPLSFKGNRSNQENYVLPREVHRRGHENRVPGTSKNQVCVVCALDEHGNSIARIASLGNPTEVKLDNAISEAINSDNVTCLYSDKEHVLRKYALRKDIPIKQAKLIKKSGKYAKNQELHPEVYAINRYLQAINSYHSRLKRFLRRFGGTSSDLLAGYLYLFTWKDKNRDKEPIEAYKELLEIMTEPNLYKSIDDIARIDVFSDIQKIEKKSTKKGFQNPERAKQIFDLWAHDMSMKKIAEKFNLSEERIRVIIKKYYELGLGYKTEKEKRKEEAILNRLSAAQSKAKRYEAKLKRNNEIYEAKQSWQGTKTEFYNEMTKKYGLKIQTIKNIISETKRIHALKNNITLGDEYTFQTLEDTRWEMTAKCVCYMFEDKLSREEAIQRVAAEHGYSPHTLRRLFSDESYVNEETQKRSISFTEIPNRDKQIFVEYLKFHGTDMEFYEYASKKYNVSVDLIRTILSFCYKADIKRYDMTHD